MKHTIFTILSAFFSLTSTATPITEMAKWQAEKVVNYLQKQEYLLTYCDCCGAGELSVIEIKSVILDKEKAAQTQGENSYGVAVIGQRIATFEANKAGETTTPLSKFELFTENISLNYTFVRQGNKAVSIATALGITEIDGKEIKACLPSIKMPYIADNSLINTSSNVYKNWYKENVAQESLSDYRVAATFQADSTHIVDSLYQAEAIASCKDALYSLVSNARENQGLTSAEYEFEMVHDANSPNIYTILLFYFPKDGQTVTNIGAYNYNMLNNSLQSKDKELKFNKDKGANCTKWCK